MNPGAKILVIWEIVPEVTKFFLMSVDPTDVEEQVRDLTIINGHYLDAGSEEEENWEKIQENLNTFSTLFDTYEKKLPDWIEELTFERLITCQPDFIFHTGVVT